MKRRGAAGRLEKSSFVGLANVDFHLKLYSSIPVVNSLVMRDRRRPLASQRANQESENDDPWHFDRGLLRAHPPEISALCDQGFPRYRLMKFEYNRG